MSNRNKIIIVVACFTVFLMLATGFTLVFRGNKQIFDTTYNFQKAVLSLPDGTVISGKVDSWRDYDDGDQIQVKIDGTTYLVHSSNIVLVSE